jgi:tetratricopeptide (TPR) repeat protein
MMRGLGVFFGNMGFPEKGRYYVEEALKLDNDSGRYFRSLSIIEFNQNNSGIALSLSQNALKINPENLDIHFINMVCYSMLNRHEEAYRSALEVLSIFKESGLSPKSGWENIGYAFFNAGHKNEAAYYFSKQIELYEEILRLDPNDSNTSTFLAGIYSFNGDIRKALQTFHLDKTLLDLQHQKPHQVASISYYNDLKFRPQYENLRKQPSFMEYLNKYLDVYRKEHDAFEKWLIEKGML